MKFSKKVKITGALGFIGLAWMSVTGAVVANQRRLVFNPTTQAEVENPQSDGHRTRHIALHGNDGTRLSGWLLLPDAPGPHPAVLYFGGRSEEVSWVVRDAGRMFPGIAVLVMNYRGYGESRGSPGEAQMVADAHMIYDWLVAHPRVKKGQVAVIGRSLGSGVAVQVASDRTCAALVLLTPYDSILALAKRRFRGIPVDWLLKHRFESIKFAESLTAPTYVLRAEEDDVVPHVHTDVLVAKLPNVKSDEIIKESDHCNLPYLEATQTKIAEILTEELCRMDEAL